MRKVLLINSRESLSENREAELKSMYSRQAMRGLYRVSQVKNIDISEKNICPGLFLCYKIVS